LAHSHAGLLIIQIQGNPFQKQHNLLQPISEQDLFQKHKLPDVTNLGHICRVYNLKHMCNKGHCNLTSKKIILFQM
jgi:hypothetical protein